MHTSFIYKMQQVSNLPSNNFIILATENYQSSAATYYIVSQIKRGHFSFCHNFCSC